MMYRRLRSTVIAAALAAGASRTAVSQCADGSPPPCRTRTVAAAVTRRADPPMDAKAWIVVPFDNLNGNQEVDWLRSASVNLLYLGMSHWTDIRVTDDKRVADYMREVPGAADAKSLSLASAVAVAKRAGAGQVVMGDILKLGSRITVNATVFDVKTGQRVRSVREETSIADSIMSVYSKLAPKVLNLPAPSGASAGAQITTSMAAYREYAEGIAELNQFNLDKGRAHLTRALELDSTFALAHAKLAVLLGWVAPGDAAGKAHAEAAGRLSGNLPPREQALIKASVAFSHGDYVASCDGFRALVKKDSTDTDAWYGLGDCLYHDTAIVPTDGDSAKPRFRADRNASLRAFRTVLALDPSYHLAYQHVVDLYNSSTVGGPNTGDWCVSGKCSSVMAIIRPSADTVIATPLMLPRDSSQYRQQTDEYNRSGARRTMLANGRKVAEQWVSANPSESRAQMMAATILASLGDIAAADNLMRRVAIPDSGQAAAAARFLQLEVNLKLWRTSLAASEFDSIRAHPFVLGHTQTGVVTTGNVATLLAPMLGRPSLYDSLITASIKASNAPPSRERLSRMLVRSTMGMAQDSLPAAVATVYGEIRPTAGLSLSTRILAPILAYAMRGPTEGWPAFDSTSSDARAMAVIAVQRKDSAALRRVARRLDSLSRVYVGSLVPDTGITIVAAEAYLALRDSARALNLARRWLDTVFTYTPLISGNSGGTLAQPLVSRAAIMRADLAAALGSRDEARLWYDRVLATWSNAEPELMPLVGQIRKSRTALAP
ncbi:MAG TPA: hypothetical protein VF483_12530 [Gemmatimonadaceae bacterium]